jgi:hypothetical protein
MLYIRPAATLQKMESSIAQTQSGLNLTADCSGGCEEPGYSGYPNFASCVNISQLNQYEFSIFLPGEALSDAEVLNTCDFEVSGSALDGCEVNVGAAACGSIGFTYFIECNTQTPCAPNGTTVTIDCEGYNPGGACDYTDNSN